MKSSLMAAIVLLAYPGPQGTEEADAKVLALYREVLPATDSYFLDPVNSGHRFNSWEEIQKLGKEEREVAVLSMWANPSSLDGVLQEIEGWSFGNWTLGDILFFEEAMRRDKKFVPRGADLDRMFFLTSPSREESEDAGSYLTRSDKEALVWHRSLQCEGGKSIHEVITAEGAGGETIALMLYRRQFIEEVLGYGTEDEQARADLRLVEFWGTRPDDLTEDVLTEEGRAKLESIIKRMGAPK